MGNTCTTCCTSADEQQSEINDVEKVKIVQNSKYTSQNNPDDQQVSSTFQNPYSLCEQKTKTNAKAPVKRSEQSDLDMLIKVQALVRGFIQRRKYRVLQLTVDGASKYFKVDEAHETVASRKKFDQNAPLKNKVHTYRTGAIYTGQWKGGLRHGQGTMVWADNARYEGGWQLNSACGKGKFYHTDGDIYDGDWLFNKANGHGVYTNIKGARYEGKWKQDQQDGRGVETWPEGAKYDGDYIQSKKEG